MPTTTTTPPKPPSIVTAVATAIRAGSFGPPERGAIALAKRYAYELDTAYAAEEAFEELRRDPDLSATMWRRLELLEKRVRAAGVVADVGPKLLAVLAALGLTPEVQLKFNKPATPPPTAANPVSPQSILEALRAEEDELAVRRRSNAAG